MLAKRIIPCLDVKEGRVVKGISVEDLRGAGEQAAMEEGESVLQIFDSMALGTPSGLLGDLNGDGFVGIADLNIVLGAWNQNVPPGDPLADPTGDGFVGIADLNVVLGNWNAGTSLAAPAGPETVSRALMGLGGLALTSRWRPPRTG